MDIELSNLHFQYRYFSVLIDNEIKSLDKMYKISMGFVADYRKKVERIYTTVLDYIYTLNRLMKYNPLINHTISLELRKKFIYLLYDSNNLFEIVKRKKFSDY